MDFVLKFISVLALALAVFASVLALISRRRRFSAWLAKEREKIVIALDLAELSAPEEAIPLLALAGPVAKVLLRAMHRRRMARADAQLSDALSLMGSALKAGLALPQALEMAAIEMSPPLGDEMKRMLAQLKLGRTVDDAFATLAQRLPTDDVALMVQSVEVLRRTGGNLIETFATLSSTIEERRRVTDRISAITMQNVMQAIILLALPWGLAAALGLLAPEFIAPLFQTRMGLALLAAAFVIESMGALWLRKIVMIRV